MASPTVSKQRHLRAEERVFACPIYKNDGMNGLRTSCTYKGRGFRNMAGVKRHLRLFHRKEIERCDMCGNFFPNKAEYQEHRRGVAECSRRGIQKGDNAQEALWYALFRAMYSTPSPESPYYSGQERNFCIAKRTTNDGRGSEAGPSTDTPTTEAPHPLTSRDSSSEHHVICLLEILKDMVRSGEVSKECHKHAFQLLSQLISDLNRPSHHGNPPFNFPSITPYTRADRFNPGGGSNHGQSRPTALLTNNTFSTNFSGYGTFDLPGAGLYPSTSGNSDVSPSSGISQSQGAEGYLNMLGAESADHLLGEPFFSARAFSNTGNHNGGETGRFLDASHFEC